MKKILLILLLAVALVALVFLIKPVGDGEEERAKAACIEACRNAKNAGQDLSNGPCLLDPISEMPDWVCDVAHSPREDVDNLPENQCSAFRQGSAKHFVEVDVNCQFIKAW